MQNFLKLLALGTFFLVSKAHAFHGGPYVNAHGGLVSIHDVEGGLGVGGAIGFHTGDLFGLEADVTYTSAGPGKLNIPLSLITKIFEFDQLETHLRFGGGFTTLHGSNFLLDFGFGGDFYVNKNISVGLLFRYDVVFESNDQGLVLMNVGFHFPGLFGDSDDIWD